MAAPTVISQTHLINDPTSGIYVQYDMRKAVSWSYGVDDTGSADGFVYVIFQGTDADPRKPVKFAASTWNTAKAASLAATGG